MASGCDNSGIAHFEQLCNSLEFDNQQYVKMIEDENQRIATLKTKIQERHGQVQGKNEDISKIDEQIKQLHKRFTWCKENLKCLENTRTIMVDHITALSKELSVIKTRAEEERKNYEEQIAKYSNIKEDYLKKYQSFPLAQELTKKMQDLSIIEEKKLGMDSMIEELSRRKKEKEAYLETKNLTRQILKLAKLKVANINVENQIHNCLVEKTRLLEQLKEIQDFRDQMDHDFEELPESTWKDIKMDIDECIAPNASDDTIQKEALQSNSVEMITANDEQESNNYVDKIQDQNKTVQIHLTPEFPNTKASVDLNAKSRNIDKEKCSDENQPPPKEMKTHRTSDATAILNTTPTTCNQFLVQKSLSGPGAAKVCVPKFSFVKPPPTQPSTRPIGSNQATPSHRSPEPSTTKSAVKLFTLPRFSFPTSFKPVQSYNKKPRSPSSPKATCMASRSIPFHSFTVPTFSNISQTVTAKASSGGLDASVANLTSNESAPVLKNPSPKYQISKADEIQPRANSFNMDQYKVAMNYNAPILDDQVTQLSTKIAESVNATDSLCVTSNDDQNEDDQPVFKLTDATDHSSNNFSMHEGSQNSSPFNLFHSMESRFTCSQSRDNELEEMHPFAMGQVDHSPVSDGFASNIFSLHPLPSQNDVGSEGGFTFMFGGAAAGKEKEKGDSMLNLNPSPSPSQSNSNGDGYFKLVSTFDKDEDDGIGMPMFNLF